MIFMRESTSKMTLDETVGEAKWEFFCKQVNDILSLQWSKEWELRFQWWREWWWNDHDIRIKYTVKISIPRQWNDPESIHIIEVELGSFTWTFNSEEIQSNEEQQINVELYLESRWINILDVIRKYYYGDDILA